MRAAVAVVLLCALLAQATALESRKLSAPDDSAVALIQVPDPEVNLFLELDALARDLEMTEEEVRGFVDDVISKVKNTCGGWINDMKTALTNSVNSIKSGAESTMNGIVTTLNGEVTSYVRNVIIAPFQSFAGKLEAARAEVQSAIGSVARSALDAKNKIESAVVTIAKRLMNPLNFPDTVTCTVPDFLSGPDYSDGDRNSYCKVSWAADKLGVGGLFDKIASLVTRHSSKSASLLEMQSRVDAGGQLVVAEPKFSKESCQGLKAAAVVLDGLDKSCNLILAALDTPSSAQFNILVLTTVFKVISTKFKADCASEGY